MMIYSIAKPSPTNPKSTTYGFEVVEVGELQELCYHLNNYAVSSGLFLGYHRRYDKLKANGNILILDIDKKHPPNSEPYYITIEKQLNKHDISYVSTPSQSAYMHSYKRHIAVVLSNQITTDKKLRDEFVEQFFEKVGIDKNMLDVNVSYNQVSHIAPATINPNFSTDEIKKYSKIVNKPLQNGKAKGYKVNERYIPTKQTSNKKENCLKPNTLIRFVDGNIINSNNIQDLKTLISIGSKKDIYCPSHNDTKPSATIYHNPKGLMIRCSVCGNIPVIYRQNLQPPQTPHDRYGYNIVVKPTTKAQKRTICDILGQYSKRIQDSLIWCYKVENIDDIYRLMLAKLQLANDGYILTTTQSIVATDKKATDSLIGYIANTQPLKIYIPKNINSTSWLATQSIKRYVMEHIVNVETCIYYLYKNSFRFDRSIKDICDSGISYFEYMLRCIDEDKRQPLQKDKRYPMRLNKKQKAKIDQKRIQTMKTTKTKNMSEMQLKVYKAINDPKYKKTNGKINKSKIYKALKISHPTLDKYIKSLKKV